MDMDNRTFDLARVVIEDLLSRAETWLWENQNLVLKGNFPCDGLLSVVARQDEFTPWRLVIFSEATEKKISITIPGHFYEEVEHGVKLVDPGVQDMLSLIETLKPGLISREIRYTEDQEEFDN